MIEINVYQRRLDEDPRNFFALHNSWRILMNYSEYQDLLFPLCVSGLMVYMMFVIYKLAEESKAGLFGTFVLFFSLGLGLVGFVAKSVIQASLGI